jgi:hypothetical protein
VRFAQPALVNGAPDIIVAACGQLELALAQRLLDAEALLDVDRERALELMLDIYTAAIHATAHDIQDGIGLAIGCLRVGPAAREVRGAPGSQRRSRRAPQLRAAG